MERFKPSIIEVVNPMLRLLDVSGTRALPPAATLSGSVGLNVPSSTCIPVTPSNEVVTPE